MLKRTVIIVGLDIVNLVGSNKLNADGVRKSIGAGNSDGLTEFQFLPLVTSYPHVWFVKSPESPVYYLRNYANNAGSGFVPSRKYE